MNMVIRPEPKPLILELVSMFLDYFSML